ncbi:MAG: hypothetical protein Q9184_001651 [Pyrenodesmia sp. 2 TL-2023]
MLPVLSTVVKVRIAASALYRSSRTGNATKHDEDMGGKVDDPEETTTQKAPKIHSRTEKEHPLSRAIVPPPRAIHPLANQRRQHVNPDEYTVLGDRIVPLSLISSESLISTARPCRTDDPLRAIQGSPTAAQDFCWSYVRVLSQIQPLPTYLSQFDYDQITSACKCFYATGVLHLSPTIQTATTTLPQDPTSTPGPAIEDATYSSPHEYHGPDAKSEATITASSVVAYGLIYLVADAESIATQHETFTLMNVPVTVVSFPRGHMTGTGMQTVIANPYAWDGGGATPSQAVVAVSVIIPFAVVIGLVCCLSLTMEALRGESSEPTLEALRMRHSEMLSAFDHYKQSKPSSGGAMIAHLTRANVVDPTPPASKKAKVMPKLEPGFEPPQLGHAFVFCSGKVIGEAQPEMSAVDAVPCGSGAPFERHDSALGESLSEADIQKHGTPAPASALIVKFSTTSPGRINSVERRGSASTAVQTPPSGESHCKNPPCPQVSSVTPMLQGEKRRGGRPRGSKNKTPSRRGGSPKQAEITRNIRKQRRKIGTDSHRGEPLMEATITKEEQRYSSPGQGKGSFYRECFQDLPGDTGRRRSSSGARLPILASRPNRTVQSTMDRAVVDPLRSQHTAQGSKVSPPSPNELPSLCNGDNALTDVFVRCIHPSLLNARDHYQGTLPDVTLLAISKQVANDTVNQDFQTFLQRYQYQLNGEQRKSIRRYTRQAYAASVRHARERTQTKSTSGSISQLSGLYNADVAAKTIEIEGNPDDPPRNPDLDENVVVAKPRDFTQPGQSENIVPFRVTNEGRRASTGNMVSPPEVVPAAPANMGASKLIEPPLATHPKRAHSASTMRGCISCRTRKRKCVFTGTSCVACTDAGIECSFWPGDRDHNIKLSNGEPIVKTGPFTERRASDSQISRRCLECSRKHLNCVPQGAGCVVCVKAGMSCSYQEVVVGSVSKLLANHSNSSITGSGAFTGHVMQEEARYPLEDYHRHVSQSFCGPDHSSVHVETTPAFTHPNSRSAQAVNRGHSPVVSESRTAFYKAIQYGISPQPSGRGQSSNQSGKSASIIQTSPKNLRGHVQVADIGNQVDRDCSEGIDWNGILYAGPTSPQTQNNTTHQVVRGETSIHPRSQPLSTLTPKLPTAFDPELELALANAISCEDGRIRPYKSSKRGHYDFVREEYVLILQVLDELDQKPHENYTGDAVELRGILKKRLTENIPLGESFSEETMTEIIKKAHSGRYGTALVSRKKKNIRAFLVDIAGQAIPLFAPPKLAKPSLNILDSASSQSDTVDSFLRNREIGLVMPGRRTNLQGTVETQIAKDIRPWKSWKGASSDVVTVAWAPDSYSYAAGAAAQSDENDLQYNRPGNLLFGNLVSNTICELPDHCVDRPKPERVKESGNDGPNSTYAVYQACDPMVYKTVTSVQFAPSGGILYTASHDHTVKIWDTTEKRPICSGTLAHEAEVTSLEVTNHHPQHFAAATKIADKSVRVYWPAQHGEQSGYQTLSFASSRALKHRDRDIFPECIRWGLAPGSKNYLLAGYQQWADHDYSAARQGHICLWDVNTATEVTVRPHASAIFSVAWHPQDDIFISGGAPGKGPLSYRTTKSVVRSYDLRSTVNWTHEFECQALDMQDVTFHPNSSSYVTAGCTDGTIYVWDYRWPDDVMHKLHHGEPLQELAANEEELPYVEHREKVDAGVMLSIWAEGGSLFYSGSSDGVIKAWDIRRSPENVWVKDVAHLPAGVQSGALSPDGMSMLVGDAVGGIHILSATRFGSEDNQGLEYSPDPINFHHEDTQGGAVDGDNPGTEGIEVANQLLKSGMLVLDPVFGVGKGPNYDGPIAECSRWNNLLTGYKELLPEIDRQQAFSTYGHEQREYSTRIKTLITARRDQMLTAKDDRKPLTVYFGPPVPFVAGRHSAASKSATVAAPGGKHIEPTAIRSTDSRSPTSTATLPLKLTACETASRDLDCDLIYLSTFPFKRKRQPSAPSTPSKRIKAEIITPSKSQSKHPQLARGQLEVEVVDLTGDGEDALSSPALAKSRNGHASLVFQASPTRAKAKPKRGSVVLDVTKEHELAEEENLLSWEEWVEEDHWWPEDC